MREFFWTYDLDIEKVREMTSMYELINGMATLNTTIKKRILKEKLCIMISEDTYAVIIDAIQRNCDTRFKMRTEHKLDKRLNIRIVATDYPEKYFMKFML